MTVLYKEDDLFKNFNQGCVLVHGCNAQHVMGSGVAAIVRRDYPHAYYDYMATPVLNLGDVVLTNLGNERWIANAITQTFYGRDGGPYADIVSIETCLQLVKTLKPNSTIIMPEIGCGLGGLSTSDVFPVVERVFADEQLCIVYSLKVTR